jgi:release factor glutamine methyltransferase
MTAMVLLTIKDALTRSAQWLAEKGLESPRLDAEVLLAHLLAMSRLDLYLAWDRLLNDKQKEQYRDLLKRRANHEPVAYIVGRREFHSLDFRVTPDVLIPRPETELLIEIALKRIRGRGEGKSAGATSPLRIADVGTGSGAIAVVLAKELPEARLTATDDSEPALKVARQNAEAHGVAQRIVFRCVSLLEGLEGSFDLIVSNPPYVSERDRETLPPDVVRYEPTRALFAGEDGLEVIRLLIPQAAERLAPGAALLLEIGAEQTAAVQDLFAADGRYEPAEPHQDFRGIERVVSAVRTA